MRLPALRHLLLAIAVLFGQALAVAHGYEHSGLVPDHGCQVCSHVQALGTGLAHTASLPVFDTVQAALPAAAPAPRTRHHAHLQPIRGPPSLPA